MQDFCYNLFYLLISLCLEGTSNPSCIIVVYQTPSTIPGVLLLGVPSERLSETLGLRSYTDLQPSPRNPFAINGRNDALQCDFVDIQCFCAASTAVSSCIALRLRGSVLANRLLLKKGFAETKLHQQWNQEERQRTS